MALRAEQIAKLADVFAVSADYIVGREAPKTKRIIKNRATGIDDEFLT